ncbi:MAG TPA: UvrD-helicase domain-containing protein [Bacteroidota bacterium]
MPSSHPKDTGFKLPDFTVISASAGSGKTHTLTLRYLQLVLSDKIPGNRLRNILAMTFTNNAAREMKQRILEYLKRLSMGDRSLIDQLLQLLGMNEEELQPKATALIDDILNNYSDFNVRTIDSFLSRLFRASALEYGFSPAVEIVLDSSAILRKAFEIFVRELSLNPHKRQVLDRLVEILLDNQPGNARYLWNPFSELSDEVLGLHVSLANKKGEVVPENGFLAEKKRLKQEILSEFKRLVGLARQSSLTVSRPFEDVIEAARSDDVDDLIRRKTLFKTPVNKPSGKDSRPLYDQWVGQFAAVQERLRSLANSYLVASARTYYLPYVEAYQYFREGIESVMRQEGRMTIADVTKHLAATIDRELVPEIYFFLGEQINHYLVDEFQDTSPLQWGVIRPLAEETLSKQGSLFLVGDTKQSIYTFRGADWQIMRRLMTGEDGFPSAPVTVKPLPMNYRSAGRIVEFSREVFHRCVPSVVTGDAKNLSGLASYEQDVRPDLISRGYVEVCPIEGDGDQSLRKAKLLEILADCRERGFSYGDITILTPKNKDVIAVSAWLNAQSPGIPFISHSSLDIRGRKITGELIAFLRFLDSPVDNLSFVTFLLGDVCARLFDHKQLGVQGDELRTFLFESRNERDSALYRSFRDRFPKVWEVVFEDLFNRVGYLPLYDLVSELYKSFALFQLIPHEEGALTKLLEVIKQFEDRGQNNLKDFLEFSEDESEDSDWSIPARRRADAVSIMTIHKAKGLENRVVVVLLEDSTPRHENLFVEEAKAGLHLLRIRKDAAEADETLAKLYAEGQTGREVDDLNKLYVALTRAEEEMYVISVKGERADRPSAFLPTNGYDPQPKPDVLRREQLHEDTAALTHPHEHASLQPVSAEKIGIDERARGEFIHAVLSHIEFLDDDIAAQVGALTTKVGTEIRAHLDAGRVGSRLVAFLGRPDVAEFFRPSGQRNVLNEHEFAMANGRLFRMDRVLVDAGVVTVIDYKTGDEREEYTEQVQTYMGILRDCYPHRAIRGVLAYVDRNVLREVVPGVLSRPTSP